MKTVHEKDKNTIQLYNDQGAHVGYIQYKAGENKQLLATHTKVYPAYEGHGYGTQLVDALAQYAQSMGDTIVPVCPFVKSLFEKMPNKYAAVLPVKKS